MSIILLLHLFISTFTFGHVQLLTVDYHSIDTPIVELNNHTLREVFEDVNYDLVELGIVNLSPEEIDIYFEMYKDNMFADDVTYVKNEMTITDLTYILGFSFVWFIIIWSIRKVVF